MNLDVLTLFPESFDWFRSQHHVENAISNGSVITTINPRETTSLSGRQVDDSPYGGGAGMVLRVDVIEEALRAHYDCDPVDLRTRRRVIALAPGGRVLDEDLVNELAQEQELTLLCGRYEGFDERIIEHFATDVISIGRYVLAGGELAAMVVADAIIRKLPGALGHEDSASEESFSAALEGMPEYPHYTRPRAHRGWEVPPVLLSGNHQRIREWRLQRSRERGT
jgi:tRNA (guanine37-N1)-methyltransferase